MNRPKVINQFRDLIDSILVVYQNDSSPKLRHFNAEDDETSVRLPTVQPIKVNDSNLQRLFDGEIARIRVLTERIRQQSSMFSRFDQFLMNVRSYSQYYDLVLFPDLLSIVKQATCDAILGDGLHLKENELNEFKAYVERYAKLDYHQSNSHPKMDLAKLRFNSTDDATTDETEFERQTTEWRKQLKHLNRETGDCMDLVRLLTSRYLIGFMKAQKVISSILNFKKDSEVNGPNSVDIKSSKSGEFDGMACLILKLLVDQTDAAVCKLLKEAKKFDDLFTDTLTKFNRLIEEALELSEKIHRVLIERMNLEDRLSPDLSNLKAGLPCGERQSSGLKDNDSVRYKRLVSKLPTDVAFLSSLKMM